MVKMKKADFDKILKHAESVLPCNKSAGFFGENAFGVLKYLIKISFFHFNHKRSFLICKMNTVALVLLVVDKLGDSGVIAADCAF